MRGKIKNKQIREFIIMTVAVFIMDIGIYIFKFQNNFSFGGVSGIAVIANKLIPFSPSFINFVINMMLLLAGFAVLGKGFGIKTAYVTVLSSVLLGIMEQLFPMTKPMTNQTGLELVYAIVLPAVAAAMLFNVNASSGGTDILAMILKKYTTMDISTALLAIDAVIVVLSFMIFDAKTGLYSVCGLVAKTMFIDSAMERMKLCKYFTIVCSHPEPICDYINEELHRSATIYEAKGAYSGEDKTVILSALDPRQTVLLERFIQKADPTAFVMVTKSSEILGKGFTSMVG